MKPELVTNRKASIFGQGLISRQRKTSAQPSFFDQFGTPAAAYSLRDLSGSNPNVIEVRRSSDNAVQDFTASEITDGSLATWVNTGGLDFTDDFAGGSTAGLNSSNVTLTAPASIGGQTDAMSVTLTGGTAIHNFSFVPVEANQLYDIDFEYYIPSGQIVNGIRLLDSVPDQFFSTLDAWTPVSLSNIEIDNNIMRFAANSAVGLAINADGDVFYIRNLTARQKISNGHVRTWYNQGSLSSRDALQTTASLQPLIVEQGVLVVDNGLPAVKGNGAQQIPFTYTEFTNDFTFLSVQNGVGFLYGASSTGGNDYVRYNVTTRMDMDGSVYQVVDNRDNLQTLSTFNKNVSNSLSMLNNGVETLPSPFAGATGNFSIRSIFSYNNSIFWTGLIQEQIFYNSDIGSNLSDAQTNINEYYSIY